MNGRWYLDRLSRMSAAEIAARIRAAIRQRRWAVPRRRPDGLATLLPGRRRATVALPRDGVPSLSQDDVPSLSQDDVPSLSQDDVPSLSQDDVPSLSQDDIPSMPAVLGAADALLDGRWPIFDLRPAAVGAAPDWFRDPLTGRRSRPDIEAFAVPYRDEAAVGNIKYVWELSRHQATTVLAAAWWLTGDIAYAERAAEHLRAWWADNPFLCGVHWSSGIEIGLRLLSWSWIRALLAEWEGVAGLFDANDACARQLYHHLVYLDRFRSAGSSANNHLIAELAGIVAACAAFPWFAESAAWGDRARQRLEAEADRQTHPDGFNREQASDYHLFVFEMLAGAALIVRLSGRPALSATETVMRRMADALAASLDAAGMPPRFGDGDDGRGVLLDAPDTPATAVALDVAGALFGRAAWWPQTPPTLLGAVARRICPEPAPARQTTRPDHFADAGITLLRHGAGQDEIYLRCDAGPHGFLSIAAHGHADALSIELRHGGVPVLADPGTYCYHGEPEWRAYFRGTLGHNTLLVDDQDQARSGGPFLWLDRPDPVLTKQRLAGPVLSWSAWHGGYRRLRDAVTHHRHVALDRDRRAVAIEDWIEAGAPHQVALAFHLGPDVTAALDGRSAALRWPGGGGTLHLPPGLDWRAHRGGSAPPVGWYSPGFGRRVPATTLVGRGSLSPDRRLCTELIFNPASSNIARTVPSCELSTAAS